MQTNTEMPTALSLSGLAGAMARGFSTNSFFNEFNVNAQPLARGVTADIFSAIGTRPPTGMAVLEGQSRRNMASVDVVIELITQNPKAVAVILSEMKQTFAPSQFANFVARLVNEMRARGLDLPVELQYTVPSTLTDLEIEAMGVAALSVGINPGAGFGGFSLTNEGGIATIGPTGKISWSGGFAALGQTGQSQFSSNAALGRAITSFFGNLFSGREDNSNNNAPPQAPPDPSPIGEGEI